MSTPETSTEAPPCMPCRGIGTVQSNQGGEPHPVPCPWCGGTGLKTVAPPPEEDNS